MFALLEDHYVLFAVAGAAIVLFFLLTFKKELFGVYDAHFFGLCYVGASSSVLALNFLADSRIPIFVVLGVVVCILSYRISFGGFRKLITSTNVGFVVNYSEPAVVVAIAICFLVSTADLIINILPAAGLVSGIGSQRFLLGANSRFLSNVEYTLASAPLFLFWLTRRPFLKFLVLLMILYRPLHGLIYESKSAVAYLIINLGIFFYCRMIFFQKSSSIWEKMPSFLKNKRIINLSFFVSLLIMVLLLPLALSLRSPDLSIDDANRIIARRILLGFDSVFYATEFKMDFPSDGLNLFQLWFASPLKVLGLFNSQWDGINQFVVLNYYGNSIQAMFPNCLLVLEVFGSVGLFWGIPILALEGWLVGYLVMFCARRRHRIAYAFLLGLIITDPFKFLIESPIFFNRLLIGGGMVFALFISEKISPDQIKRRMMPFMKSIRRKGV